MFIANVLQKALETAVDFNSHEYFTKWEIIVAEELKFVFF